VKEARTGAPLFGSAQLVYKIQDISRNPFWDKVPEQRDAETSILLPLSAIDFLRNRIDNWHNVYQNNFVGNSLRLTRRRLR
jgi:hypothetical protein